MIEKYKLKEIYRCKHCGNTVQMLHDYGPELVCCGEPMELLKANTTDAAHEKHVPSITQVGSHINITVGTSIHPMLSEHYIEWIMVQTRTGEYVRYFKPGDKPETTFDLNGGVPVAVYAYCNLHGLWMAKVKLPKEV